MIYTLNRKGTALNTGMCGAEGETRLFYEVKIVSENCELDDNGFMIPHEVIGKIAEDALQEAVSCELGAIDIFNHCSRVLKRHDIPLSTIDITVGMVNGKAHFTVSEDFLIKSLPIHILDSFKEEYEHPITPI